MTIKTILVPLEGDGTGASALEAALLVARTFGAHIEALHPMADPQRALIYAAEPMSGDSAALVMEAAEGAARTRAEKARAAFDSFCSTRSVPVAERGKPGDEVFAVWKDETGVPGRIVARHGRLADLIVAARPRPDDPAPELLETALLETGRPLLVAPPAVPASVGNHMIVAWNGSAEAAGALAAAMPFIERATRVTVATVNGGTGASDPAAVVAYLAWHGVEAGVAKIEPGDRDDGEALLAEAAKLGGDLLVMGGYGHSRMREVIFGGVTRHVLTHSDIPVLMAH